MTNQPTSQRKLPCDKCGLFVTCECEAQPAAPAVGERPGSVFPLPYWAVFLPDSSNPEIPIALFEYGDMAGAWATANYQGRSRIAMFDVGEHPCRPCRNWSREVAKQADELLAVSEAFYKFRVAVAAKLGLANCDTPVLLAELDRLRVACKEIASLLQTMRAECDELRAKCETESRAATYWWRAYMALAKGSCPEPTIEGDRQAVKEFEDYEKQLSWIADSLAGVQGALADAGGEILCIREDGNYGESVRQIVGERDSLRAKLAEAEAKVGKMLELHRHVEAAHVFCSECERIAKGA